MTISVNTPLLLNTAFLYLRRTHLQSQQSCLSLCKVCCSTLHGESQGGFLCGNFACSSWEPFFWEDRWAFNWSGESCALCHVNQINLIFRVNYYRKMRERENKSEKNLFSSWNRAGLGWRKPCSDISKLPFAFIITFPNSLKYSSEFAS